MTVEPATTALRAAWRVTEWASVRKGTALVNTKSLPSALRAFTKDLSYNIAHCINGLEESIHKYDAHELGCLSVAEK